MKLKRIYILIIGIIIGSLLVGIKAYADILIQASSVGYTDTNNIGATNVQKAIENLYDLAKTKKRIQAWEYHETGNNKCINGEENTCIPTTCYQSGSTCPMGTVIKYYVNDNEYRYFYVLRDSGTVITMQQRENTIRNIAWHAGSNDNSNGPDTILPILEQATSTWTNVNILEYTPGTTILYQNAYTGCIHSGGANGTYLTSCDANSYTSSVLGTRTARARMITALEASSTGCLVNRDGSEYPTPISGQESPYNYGSCPDFMHNYLYSSTGNGGSYNDNTKSLANQYDYGYWTISANSHFAGRAWIVANTGSLGHNTTSNESFSARAVVEITK